MLRSNMVSKSVEFFGPDGCRYSKSATIMEILHFPFFKMQLDSSNEYHVHSTRAFKQDLSVMSAGEREFANFAIKEYNNSELKARSGAKLLHYLIERLEQGDEMKTYSHKEVSSLLRSSIAR